MQSPLSGENDSLYHHEEGRDAERRKRKHEDYCILRREGRSYDCYLCAALSSVRRESLHASERKLISALISERKAAREI